MSSSQRHQEQHNSVRNRRHSIYKCLLYDGTFKSICNGWCSSASQFADSVGIFDGNYAVLAVTLRMHPMGACNEDFKTMMPLYLDAGREVFFDPRRDVHDPAIYSRRR